ncbi:arsenate-mycothiol transferase ArsC [Cellulomonas sp. CW35]|nr:heat-shock protein HtpX [Cellulomonas uda]NII68030.1 protein-tyrosine-phosphatase [Cellulomonas uda]
MTSSERPSAPPSLGRRLTAEGGPGAMINVLFVCVHNAGRSQLAAGLAEAIGGGRLSVASAGTEPEDHVSDVVIGSLAEVGVDWTGRTPTRLTRQAVEAADVVVALKPSLVLPQVDGVRYETWPLPDPAGWDLDGIRPLREHLRERIESLASSSTPTTP